MPFTKSLSRYKKRSARDREERRNITVRELETVKKVSFSMFAPWHEERKSVLDSCRNKKKVHCSFDLWQVKGKENKRIKTVRWKGVTRRGPRGKKKSEREIQSTKCIQHNSQTWIPSILSMTIAAFPYQSPSLNVCYMPCDVCPSLLNFTSLSFIGVCVILFLPSFLSSLIRVV